MVTNKPTPATETKSVKIFISMRSQPNLETMAKLLMDSKYQPGSNIMKREDKLDLRYGLKHVGGPREDSNVKTKSKVLMYSGWHPPRAKVVKLNKCEAPYDKAKEKIKQTLFKAKASVDKNRHKDYNMAIRQYQTIYQQRDFNVWTSKPWLTYSSKIKLDSDANSDNGKSQAKNSFVENQSIRMINNSEADSVKCNTITVNNRERHETDNAIQRHIHLPSRQRHVVLPHIPTGTQIDFHKSVTLSCKSRRDHFKDMSDRKFDMKHIILEPICVNHNEKTTFPPQDSGIADTAMQSSKFIKPTSFTLAGITEKTVTIKRSGENEVELGIVGDSMQAQRRNPQVVKPRANDSLCIQANIERKRNRGIESQVYHRPYMPNEKERQHFHIKRKESVKENVNGKVRQCKKFGLVSEKQKRKTALYPKSKTKGSDQIETEESKWCGVFPMQNDSVDCKRIPMKTLTEGHQRNELDIAEKAVKYNECHHPSSMDSDHTILSYQSAMSGRCPLPSPVFTDEGTVSFADEIELNGEHNNDIRPQFSEDLVDVFEEYTNCHERVDTTFRDFYQMKNGRDEISILNNKTWNLNVPNETMGSSANSHSGSSISEDA